MRYVRSANEVEQLDQNSEALVTFSSFQQVKEGNTDPGQSRGSEA